jgi:flagellin
MPATGDLTKIRTNIAALNALNALGHINSKLSATNLKLATGKRINSAGDDPSGLTLSSSLDLRARRLGTASNNIGDATSVLSIAESGANSIYSILATLSEKISVALSDTQGVGERAAIFQEINQLGEELDAISIQTQFNGIVLLTANTLTFQVGADTRDTAVFRLTNSFTSAALGVNSLTVATQALASISLGSANAAITSVQATLQQLGALLQRFAIKSEILAVAKLNTSAAASRILDADLAAEQLEASKLQILQQTATAQLAAANTAPASILRLFQ